VPELFWFKPVHSGIKGVQFDARSILTRTAARSGARSPQQPLVSGNNDERKFGSTAGLYLELN
jgi:hypothetical protein